MDADITIECLVHHMTTGEPVPGRAVEQRNGHPERRVVRSAATMTSAGIVHWMCVCSIVIHGWMQCNQWISTSHDSERTYDRLWADAGECGEYMSRSTASCACIGDGCRLRFAGVARTSVGESTVNLGRGKNLRAKPTLPGARSVDEAAAVDTPAEPFPLPRARGTTARACRDVYIWMYITTVNR